MTNFPLPELLKCEAQDGPCGICFACEFRNRMEQEQERERRKRRHEEEVVEWGLEIQRKAEERMELNDEP